MRTIHVSLIGAQPLPILIPARHLQADETVLVHTTNAKSTSVAKRLKNLIKNSQKVSVDPYEFNKTVTDLRQVLPTKETFSSSSDKLIFNLTGGTKIMAIAAYELAAEYGADFVYFESERARSILRHYSIQDDVRTLTKTDVIDSHITIDDFLRAYLPGYDVTGFHTNDNGKLSDGGVFEEAVYDALAVQDIELLAGVKPKGVAEQLDIDLVIRYGNQFGVAEVKRVNYNKKGRKPKQAIDQLSTIGSNEYLGIYTQKFVISAYQMNEEIHTLADEHGVKIIELTSFRSNARISESDRQKLINTIMKKLSGTP